MRTSVIVHYNSHEFIKNLDRNIFSIYYNSKKYNYVYLYLNKSNKDRALKILNNVDAIVDIEDSLLGVDDISF